MSLYRRLLPLLALALYLSLLPLCLSQLSEPLPVAYPANLGVTATDHYSGYLNTSFIQGNATQYDASLFYYFVRNTNASAPLVVWLQGGPGCTSLVGLFTENGPFLLSPPTPTIPYPFSLSINAFTWSSSFHLLYIDQPIGTGFSPPSSIPIPSNEAAVATTLYLALCRFYDLFPLLVSNPLFLTGESYAGKYIPSVATLILLRNDVVTGSSSFTNASTVSLDSFAVPTFYSTLSIPLAGLALGNALVNPTVQRFAYRQQALASSLINTAQAAVLTSLEHRCSHALSTLNDLNASAECPLLLQYIEARAANISLYDIERYDPTINKPLIAAFMSDQAIHEALHVSTNRTYDSDCAAEVKDAMAEDVYHSVAELLPALFSHLRVLFYNGNMDMKDGSRGTEELLHSLPSWPDRFSFSFSPRIPFYPTPQDPTTAPYGFAQSFGSVTSVVIPMAGHFSPHDRPQAVLSMMRTWIEGQQWGVAATACQVPEGCGTGTCVVDRCDCEVELVGARCETKAYNITEDLITQQSASSHEETLSCQQSVVYHLYMANASSLPPYIYAHAHSDQVGNSSMLMDMLYLAPSPSLSPALALNLLAQFDPSNVYLHHHHPLLSPDSAFTTPSLLSSSRNTAADAFLVTPITTPGHYAIILTNLHPTPSTFSLRFHPDNSFPSLSSSFTFPFDATAVGLLAALLSLAAFALLVIVVVRRCALYRRKGGKRYGKVVGEGVGTAGVVGGVGEGTGEWEEGMKEMDSLELQLSDEGDDLSEITVRRGDGKDAVWGTQGSGVGPGGSEARGGKKSPSKEEEKKAVVEVRSSPDRVVPSPAVSGGNTAAVQGAGEGRERAIPIEPAVQLPSEEQSGAVTAKKKKARKKRPEV